MNSEVLFGSGAPEALKRRVKPVCLPERRVYLTKKKQNLASTEVLRQKCVWRVQEPRAK